MYPEMSNNNAVVRTYVLVLLIITTVAITSLTTHATSHNCIIKRYSWMFLCAYTRYTLRTLLDVSSEIVQLMCALKMKF